MKRRVRLNPVIHDDEHQNTSVGDEKVQSLQPFRSQMVFTLVSLHEKAKKTTQLLLVIDRAAHAARSIREDALAGNRDIVDKPMMIGDVEVQERDLIAIDQSDSTSADRCG